MPFIVSIAGEPTEQTPRNLVEILHDLGFYDIAVLDAQESINFQARFPHADVYNSMRSYDGVLDAFLAFQTKALLADIKYTLSAEHDQWLLTASK